MFSCCVRVYVFIMSCLFRLVSDWNEFTLRSQVSVSCNDLRLYSADLVSVFGLFILRLL